MPETIITYETLYEILRKEKYEKELQSLDRNFFQNVVKYLEEKQNILNSQKDKKGIFSSEIEKTKKQLSNIKKILKELYDRRENKIIQLALFSSRIKGKEDISAMLPEEKKLYKNLVETLNLFRRDILFNILSPKLPKLKPKDIKIEKKEPKSTKLVRVLHSIPKFVGDDLNVYGPFEREDISNLPKKVAEVLIKKNRAKEIKI